VTLYGRAALAVVLGVVLLSPDGLVIRTLDLDAETVLFLRGACTALGFLALIGITTGGVDLASLRTRQGLAIAGLATVGNVSFVLSIRGAGAAVALAIIAAGPMFAAILSRLLIGEIAPRRTSIAAVVVLAGVAVIVLTQPRGEQLGGAIAALCGSLAVATLLVIVRQAHGINVLACQAGGAILLALVALPLAHLGAASGPDIGLAIAFFGIFLPVALALILSGPRYLSAPEVSLLTLIETVLGPVWVWLALGERPPVQTALAGAVIVVTLFIHGLLGRRAIAAGRVSRSRAQASAANP
jgi:drug/metabolite transporter (DMT)-like permease